MTSKHEDLLNKKSDISRQELEQALLSGNLEAAINACMTRGILQARQLHRIDFNLKHTAIEQTAKATKNYANTIKGFGLNLSTGLNICQTGSGMFGLAVGLNPSLLSYFTAQKLTFQEVTQASQTFQSAFGLGKGLTDESNQYHRTIKQADVENAKRIQDDYKEKAQRANASARELEQQLKSLDESKHRAKMSASGG